MPVNAEYPQETDNRWGFTLSKT